MSIPKLLFQTWKSTTVIPANFAHWSQTLRDHNPAYEYMLWDDADNRAFIAGHYPWFLETYDAYPAEIFRADAVRYFFLYHFGGIYADMDTECLRPLDGMLDVADVVLGRMGTDPHFVHSLPNALMMSRPRQEFWLLVISLLVDPPASHKARKDRPEFATGPVILKRAHDLYAARATQDTAARRMASIRTRLPLHLAPSPGPTRVAAVPGYIFFPVDWNDRIHLMSFCRPLQRQQKFLDRKTTRSLFPRSLTVSYWTHSWEKKADYNTGTGEDSPVTQSPSWASTISSFSTS
ncbi:MAG: glycosyltransferase [Pseudomonadota bacterium]